MGASHSNWNPVLVDQCLDARIVSAEKKGLTWARGSPFMRQCVALHGLHGLRAVLTARPDTCSYPPVLLGDRPLAERNGYYFEISLTAPGENDDIFSPISVGFTSSHDAFATSWGFGPQSMLVADTTVPLENFIGFPLDRELFALYIPEDRRYLCLFVDNRLVIKTFLPRNLLPTGDLLPFVIVQGCPLGTVVSLRDRTVIPQGCEVRVALEDEFDQSDVLCDQMKDGSPSLANKGAWMCRLCSNRNAAGVEFCNNCNRRAFGHARQRHSIPEYMNLSTEYYSAFVQNATTPRGPRVASDLNHVTGRSKQTHRGPFCVGATPLDECVDVRL